MKLRNLRLAANCQGFTLVELMITLAMAGIIVAAIYAAYNIQQKTYFTQGQVVDMQQNIRAGLEMMSSDMRMAGYDPTGKASAAITLATASKFAFTQDLNGDGSLVAGAANPNENISYSFAAADDADDNGIADTPPATQTAPIAFRRDSNGGGLQAIAEGIQAIEFYYTLKNKTTGVITQSLTPSNLEEIQTVQITILAVASQRDAKYTNTETYTTASGALWTPTVLSGSAAGDNFRRRLLTSSVMLRNYGLK